MIDGHNNQFMNNALIFVRLRDINTGSFINWAAFGDFVSMNRQYTITRDV